MTRKSLVSPTRDTLEIRGKGAFRNSEGGPSTELWVIPNTGGEFGIVISEGADMIWGPLP